MTLHFECVEIAHEIHLVVVMSFIECVCGEEQEIDDLAEHLRREHFRLDLPYSCGICDFSSTSEGSFLSHCALTGHNPRLDKRVVVRQRFRCSVQFLRRFSGKTLRNDGSRARSLQIGLGSDRKESGEEKGRQKSTKVDLATSRAKISDRS